MILSTGILIFYPICFVKTQFMQSSWVLFHYTQYIALTYKVTRKRLFENKFEKLVSKNYNLKFVIFILLYSILMTLVSFMGQQADIVFKI